jgi:hypothetical protein
MNTELREMKWKRMRTIADHNLRLLRENADLKQRLNDVAEYAMKMAKRITDLEHPIR